MMARVAHRGPDDEGSIEVAGNLLGQTSMYVAFALLAYFLVVGPTLLQSNTFTQETGGSTLANLVPRSFDMAAFQPQEATWLADRLGPVRRRLYSPHLPGADHPRVRPGGHDRRDDPGPPPGALSGRLGGVLRGPCGRYLANYLEESLQVE